jgi:dihydrofolate reductase
MTQGHVFIGTSLDGFIARADGGIDWLMDKDFDAGPDEDFGYGVFIAGIDAVIMGSGTYRTARGFPEWPFRLPVVVMTSRPAEMPADPPPDVSLTGESPAALMDRLAAEGVGHVYVDGGALIRSFLAAGLIADLVLTRLPILISQGLPLFGALPGDVKLEHLTTRVLPRGLVQSRYRVRR